jgi:ATP-dependent helicase/nuclease subunit B
MVIQPIQRGLIVHELLECIYRELKNLGLLPLSSQSQSDVMEVVDRELEGYLHSYQQRESVGIPVFWEIEKRSICDAVKIFLIGEMRDESSLVPVYFEKRFGYGRMENEVAFNTKKRKIFFRGRIDRIDVGEDGNFRVIDYKTGKLHGRDNDLGGGSKLQLPVYLVAASKIVDTDPSRGEACYRKVSISEGKDTLTFTGKLWNRESEHFEDILNVLLRTMERGIFVAVPSMDSCRYCPVRVCCPTGKDQIFERKVSGEKRMDEFLRMKRFGI